LAIVIGMEVTMSVSSPANQKPRPYQKPAMMRGSVLDCCRRGCAARGGVGRRAAAARSASSFMLSA
jgi:hypothetical protein